MFKKWADKKTKDISANAVVHAKEAIVEDVKKNKTGYIMAGITGLVIATGVVMIVKAAIGGITPAHVPVQTIKIVINNYYANVPPRA